MGRHIGAVCRLCRAEKTQLFLKGTRCFSPKCAVVKRKSTPGVRGKKRMRKITDYGLELREKQKVKRMYGLLEKQFYNTFVRADSKLGKTGDNLLIFLERRLDNIVYKSNFASSRSQARQLVNHGHFKVNGRKVNIPSFQIRSGDIIEAKQESKNLGVIREGLKKEERPSWIEVDENEVKVKIIHLPVREDIRIAANEQLIVEFYSK